MQTKHVMEMMHTGVDSSEFRMRNLDETMEVTVPHVSFEIFHCGQEKVSCGVEFSHARRDGRPKSHKLTFSSSWIE